LLLAVFTGLLLIVAVAAWWWMRADDPYAGLDDAESDASHGVTESGALHLAADGTPAERLRRLDEQLRSDPRNPTVLADKIHVALEYAPASAAEECRRILAESPLNYFALHHAAMAYLATTNLDRALYYAAAALQVRDTVEAHFVAGHTFYAKGDFPNALKHYRAASAKDPQNDSARDYVTKAERAMAAKTNPVRPASIPVTTGR
jgi:tetratricopeptide (TPR) repeat protein